ncbi:DUF2167 domain-containing protein [Aurantiacibacter zhengii]|nr:DUF2167 domain-containing protein [Aurantiacibacter zhengii]
MELPPEVQQMLDSLQPQRGTVEIAAADATLDLGDQYDFYAADDARTILVNLWGNHPDEATGVLGLVMPAGASPLSDAWGAVVTYEATGFVSDEDAADADYNELMDAMREGSVELNEERRAQGYPGVDILGWAQSPAYDAGTHSVIWARELDFDDTDVNTLNYDLRTLGRSGVLSINLISSMPNLAEIQTAANDFASHAAFNPGARYSDYQEGDPRAGYGIAGLVAGGAGLAVAKKAGVLAVLLKFIKPILLGAVVLFGAFAGRIKRFFVGEEPHEEYYEEDYAADGYAEQPMAYEGAVPAGIEQEPEPPRA